MQQVRTTIKNKGPSAVRISSTGISSHSKCEFAVGGFFLDSAKNNTTWEYADNPVHGTEGGKDVNDCISLLSLQDITKKEYGFPTGYFCDHPSRAGYQANTVEDSWWLRSPGSRKNTAAFTSNMGAVTVPVPVPGGSASHSRLTYSEEDPPGGLCLRLSTG